MKNAFVSLSMLLALLTFATSSPLLLHAQNTATPKTGPMAENGQAQTSRSTSLSLSVEGKTSTITVAELQAMTQKKITVHNEHTKADETYSGVLLGDLLSTYGFPVNKTTHRKMLRSYLIAEGTDKYWVLYSITEIEPSEHNADVIVATSMDGKPLGADGELKLIDSRDKKPERWVRNLTAITLKSAE